MKLYLKGHDLKFAAQQMYMCLFPNSHASFAEDEPVDGYFIISEMHTEKDGIRCSATVHINGEAGNASVFETTCGCDENETKRRMSRAVKNSLYRACVPMLEKPPLWGALTGIRPSKVAARYLTEGLSAEESAAKMTEDYYVSPKRAQLAVKCAMHAKKVSENSKKLDFSLYVGIPFCASRCRYCSFVSHSVEKAGHLIAPYLDMLEYELKMLGKTASDNGLKLRSVYVGGGTPTSLSAEELLRVMTVIRNNFDVSDCDEYTVEGGRPDTISREKIEVIRDMGASRISVNPQTMNDDILKAMDRRHTAEDVVKTVENVRALSGLEINTDLIAGLPGDNIESFRRTVEEVIALNPENITVHSLALKKGSFLRQEKYLLPTNDTTAEMVEYAMNALAKAGYEPYYLYRQKYMSGNLENVGYSKPGCECLYNSYIMDELHTIMSAGAGGVTKLIDREKSIIKRIFNPKYPYEYNKAKEKTDSTRNEINTFFSGI